MLVIQLEVSNGVDVSLNNMNRCQGRHIVLILIIEKFRIVEKYPPYLKWRRNTGARRRIRRTTEVLLNERKIIGGSVGIAAWAFVAHRK